MAEGPEIITEDPNKYAALVVVAEGAVIVGTYLGSKAVVYELVKEKTYDPVAKIQAACDASPTIAAEGQTVTPNCNEAVGTLVDTTVDQGENAADTLSDTAAIFPTLFIALCIAIGHRRIRQGRA